MGVKGQASRNDAMLTPFAHIATALSFFMSGQLTLPTVSRAWVSEPAAQRCTSKSHKHWNKQPASAEPGTGTGRPASRSIQIVSFGP